MAMELAQLGELIDFLRAKGVTHYRANEIELVLGPEPSNNTNGSTDSDKESVDPEVRDRQKLIPDYLRNYFEAT